MGSRYLLYATLLLWAEIVFIGALGTHLRQNLFTFYLASVWFKD